MGGRIDGGRYERSSWYISRESVGHDKDYEADNIPSSRFVPVIIGMRANCPSANNDDGRSGIIPPGPSITGEKGKNDCVPSSAILVALSNASKLVDRRQASVSPCDAFVHSGTAETRSCHRSSLSEARISGFEAAEPDSSIYSAASVIECKPYTLVLPQPEQG